MSQEEGVRIDPQEYIRRLNDELWARYPEMAAHFAAVVRVARTAIEWTNAAYWNDLGYDHASLPSLDDLERDPRADFYLRPHLFVYSDGTWGIAIPQDNDAPWPSEKNVGLLASQPVDYLAGQSDYSAAAALVGDWEQDMTFTPKVFRCVVKRPRFIRWVPLYEDKEAVPSS